MKPTVIAFDADDTLWHNETLFTETHTKFHALLAEYHPADWVQQRLYATELRNLERYGYGIKGFTLSMIETAIELTEGRIGGKEVARILHFADEMRDSPLQLLPDVADVTAALSEKYSLMVITKGDLFDQEGKLARSGLGDRFAHFDVVSEKDAATYRRVLQKYAIDPATFLMVGNSVKSDILPVLEIGGQAIHIPYAVTWAYEIASTTNPNFPVLQRIGDLLGFLQR